MTTRAVIPIKAPAEVKLRLASVLTPEERATLAAAMLAAVVKAAQAAHGLDEVMLIGPCDYPLAMPPPRLTDPGDGLNAALAAALAQAAAQGITRLIILPADLPLLTPDDIERLAVPAPADTIRLAPDRHHVGTNALSLPLPAASAFRFAFGEDSRAAHRAEAKRLELPFSEIFTAGLAKDIDLPSDLDDMPRSRQNPKIIGESWHG